MAETFDLILKNARAVLPHPVSTDLHIAEVDIGTRDGKIADISSRIGSVGATSIDCKGLTVLPGMIDPQVHFREPGNEHKEDLQTGTHGAVLGGITTVFEMPNTKPSTCSTDLLDDKVRRTCDRVWCDIGFYGGASIDFVQNISAMESHPHCLGIKVFMGSSTGSLLVADDASLEQVLKTCRRRVTIHAEDEDRLKQRRYIAETSHDVHDHPVWRDELTAVLATQRILRLARKLRRKVHVLHITTAQEVGILAQHQDCATAEVTPQHLSLSAPECYDRLGTKAQMNPPIRGEDHRQALWRGVDMGVFTMIGSDHAPHTIEEKSKRYPLTPSGMTGVQTLVPIMLNHVAEGRLSLERLCELSNRNPARVFAANEKGDIRVGADADFTIVDLNRIEKIDNSWIASRSGWTPFHDMKVKGWPITTIVRGHVVVREGALQGSPIGRPVNFRT